MARVSTLFFGALAVVSILSFAMLWMWAAATGIVGDAEGFMSDLGFQEFSFDALQLLRVAMLVSLALVLFGAGLSALAAVLYNAVCGVAGGIEVVERPRRAARREPPRTQRGVV